MAESTSKEKILIVEDLFIEANSLRSIMERFNYEIHPICSSVNQALRILDTEKVHFVMLDIYLKGNRTGIELGHILKERGIPFIYISANSDEATLEKAKVTSPYGFLVKPFRVEDVVVTMKIAHYHFQNTFQKLAALPAPDVAPHIQFSLPVVGNSKSLQGILKEVMVVAPAETTVLILGESGTGKEVISQRIHELSPRHNGPLIKVNCASLPEHLIESELFGHEKGSFTGAVEMRKGKFERAHGGTLFLDEIGELPYPLQSKLLRELQEHEFERVGSNKTITTDVRIIAATNQNLQKAVAEGRFRLDLYYRLNVFPVHLPPLRERKEDIPALVHHFINKFSKKTGKPVSEVTQQAINGLLDYHWPGNIRELENIIERAVIMCSGNRITEIILYETQAKKPAIAEDRTKVKSMIELERDHIIHVLRQCKGRVFGANGAAELLDMKVSTLNFRIKKLGIDKSQTD